MSHSIMNVQNDEIPDFDEPIPKEEYIEMKLRACDIMKGGDSIASLIISYYDYIQFLMEIHEPLNYDLDKSYVKRFQSDNLDDEILNIIYERLFVYRRHSVLQTVVEDFHLYEGYRMYDMTRVIRFDGVPFDRIELDDEGDLIIYGMNDQVVEHLPRKPRSHTKAKSARK